MLNYMLQTANPTSPFKNRLKELLEDYEGIVSLNAMGFPKNWNDEKIWKSQKIIHSETLRIEKKSITFATYHKDSC